MILGSGDTRKCSGDIPGTVDILRELRSRDVPIYALSNWSAAETFRIALNRFECLSWFNGVLLSGEVKVLKPDRRIFEIFLDTFRIEASGVIYIDDRSENVAAIGLSLSSAWLRRIFIAAVLCLAFKMLLPSH